MLAVASVDPKLRCHNNHKPKNEIFAKELAGSGTEIVPVWDNINRLKDIMLKNEVITKDDI